MVTMNPYSFNGCSGLESVEIGGYLQIIPSHAFSGCTSLETVTLGSGIKTIDTYAFSGCSSLSSISLPDSVTTIENYAFSNSGLTSINTNATSTIGDYAFYNSSITTAVFHTGLVSIGREAFRLSNISGDIIFPSTLETIGREAFYLTPIDSVIFSDGSTSTTLYIGQSAFAKCSSLFSVSLGNRTSIVGNNAFQDCSSMVSLTMGESLTSIGNYAFSGCTALMSNLIFPSSLIEIGTSAFNATNVQSVNFDITGSSLTTIGERAFFHCVNLTGTLEVPNNVTEIGTYAFSECNLISIKLGPNTTTLGSYAFSGNTHLTEVIIPNVISGINLRLSNNLFSECPLEKVYISSSVTAIDAKAIDFSTSAATTMDIWFNDYSAISFSAEAIRSKNGATLNIHTNSACENAVNNMKTDGYITGTSTVVFVPEYQTLVNFATPGFTPMYNSVYAINGSKVILPYYYNGPSYGSVYYSVVDNGDNHLSVFASDTDYTNNIVASSGKVISVYPFKDGDSVRMSGAETTTDYIKDYEIRTTVVDDKDLPVTIITQTTHYGGAITVPGFSSSLINVKTIYIVKKYEEDGSYQIDKSMVGQTIYAGHYFSKFVLDFEDVMINVKFISKGEEVTESVKLMSKFEIPSSLSYMEIPPAGYEFNGWWDAPGNVYGTGGVRATATTQFNINDVWYAHFKPLECTVTMDNWDDNTPTYHSQWTMYGPFTLYIVDNSLYYQDARETVNKLMFDKGSVPGWSVSSYINSSGNVIASGTTIVPQVEDPHATNLVVLPVSLYLEMSINHYDFTLQFYNGTELIPDTETFYINGWAIGSGNEYKTGDTIEDVSYAFIENGLVMPVPVNQTYAFTSMVAGTTTISPVSNEYKVILDYFDGSDSIVIKYIMGTDLYTIQFNMNDDSNYTFTDGPYGEGDEFWLLGVNENVYRKVGYTFDHYAIAIDSQGTTADYPQRQYVTLSPEMISGSEYCVITVNAIWLPDPYTISFSLDPYSGTVPSQVKREGETIVLPDITGYHGYQPESWYWKNGTVVSAPFTEDQVLTPELISLYADGERNMTICVNWELTTYTLRVDPASGYTSFPTLTAKYGESFTLWENTYTRQFMTFAGWSVGTEIYDNASTVTVDDNMAVAGDANGGEVLFGMSWADIHYQVQYNLEKDVVGPIPVDYGAYVVNQGPFSLAVLDESETYRYGYSFVGWKYAIDEYVVYTNTSGLFDQVLAANANDNNIVMFYAVWSQKSYKIAYNLDSGRSGTSAPTNVLYGDNVIISNPSRVGFDFGGWTAEGLTSGALYYSSSNMFMLWNGTTQVTSERFKDLCNNNGATVTLTAHWVQASYVISYNANGGSGTVIGGQTSIMVGDVIELPVVKDPRKTGYGYVGWGVDTVNALAAGTVLTESMAELAKDNTLVMYMIWDANSYQVRYRYTPDYEYSNITADYGDSVYIPILDRSGFAFKGWSITGAGPDAYYSKDGVSWYKLGATIVDCSYFRSLATDAGLVVTMEAQWSPNEYRIAYNTNGGTGKAPVDSKIYKVGDTVEMKDYKDLNGTNGSKIITGWSLDVNGTAVNIVEFTEGLCKVADATNTVNLYGVWVNDMCLVVVDLEGSTASAIPAGWTQNADGTYEKLVVYGTSTKEAMADWNDVTISKEGYNFSGWSYTDSTVIATVDVTPNFEKVDMSILYIFGGVIGVFAVGAIVITKL